MRNQSEMRTQGGVWERGFHLVVSLVVFGSWIAAGILYPPSNEFGDLWSWLYYIVLLIFGFDLMNDGEIWARAMDARKGGTEG